MEGKLASYIDSKIPQYKGNPLIEALPQNKSDLELIKELTVDVDWFNDLDVLDDDEKIYAMDSIQYLFQPIPKVLDMKKSIDRLIRVGYMNRNPLSKDNLNHQVPNIAIIGVSGIGKTTTIDRVLSTYNQTIYHNSYKDVPYKATQIVWIKLNTPFDGSLKSLLFEFYGEIDKLLKTKYFERFSKNRATTDIMMQSISNIAKSCNVGLIVIDEIQNLENVSNKNKMMVMNFFVSLSNTIGIPLVLVSTPAGIELLRQDFRQARRMVSAIDSIIWDKLENDESWSILVNSIMKYQITPTKASCEKELIDTFYNESGGIVDILKKLHISSQVLALKRKADKVDREIIVFAAKQSLKLIEPMMTSIHTPNPFGMLLYPDINIPEKLRVDTKVSTSRKTKIDKKKANGGLKQYSNPQDLREVIKFGNLEGKNAYLSLKDAGYTVEDI